VSAEQLAYGANTEAGEEKADQRGADSDEHFQDPRSDLAVQYFVWFYKEGKASFGPETNGSAGEGEVCPVFGLARC
jgi:hypothetical protein